VLAALYSDDAYYARCRRYLDEVRPRPGVLRRGWLRPLLHAVWGIGIAGRRRKHFWKLLARGLRQGGAGFAQAVTLAIIGEHLVRYTQEIVLPRLDRALAGLERDLSSPMLERVAAGSRGDLAGTR
jgi:hypothetical protein